jgi:AhpD family alkylhydroperoxidase
MVKIDHRGLFPAGAKALAGLDEAVRASTLESGLLELVRLRASQINGCAYCLALHSKDARSGGEHQVRLDTVAAWRESPFYSPRERAALAWCEKLTELSHTKPTEEDLTLLGQWFTPVEIAALTCAIVVINGWNRLAVGLGADFSRLGIPALPHAAGPATA